jgi:hypothetical protein
MGPRKPHSALFGGIRSSLSAHSTEPGVRFCKLSEPGRGNPGLQFPPLRAAFCREAFRGPVLTPCGSASPPNHSGDGTEPFSTHPTPEKVVTCLLL